MFDVLGKKVSSFSGQLLEDSLPSFGGIEVSEACSPFKWLDNIDRLIDFKLFDLKNKKISLNRGQKVDVGYAQVDSSSGLPNESDKVAEDLLDSIADQIEGFDGFDQVIFEEGGVFQEALEDLTEKFLTSDEVAGKFFTPSDILSLVPYVFDNLAEKAKALNEKIDEILSEVSALIVLFSDWDDTKEAEILNRQTLELTAEDTLKELFKASLELQQLSIGSESSAKNIYIRGARKHLIDGLLKLNNFFINVEEVDVPLVNEKIDRIEGLLEDLELLSLEEEEIRESFLALEELFSEPVAVPLEFEVDLRSLSLECFKVREDFLKGNASFVSVKGLVARLFTILLALQFAERTLKLWEFPEIQIKEEELEFGFDGDEVVLPPEDTDKVSEGDIIKIGDRFYRVIEVDSDEEGNVVLKTDRDIDPETTEEVLDVVDANDQIASYGVMSGAVKDNGGPFSSIGDSAKEFFKGIETIARGVKTALVRLDNYREKIKAKIEKPLGYAIKGAALVSMLNGRMGDLNANLLEIDKNPLVGLLGIRTTNHPYLAKGFKAQSMLNELKNTDSKNYGRFLGGHLGDLLKKKVSDKIYDSFGECSFIKDILDDCGLDKLRNIKDFEWYSDPYLTPKASEYLSDLAKRAGRGTEKFFKGVRNNFLNKKSRALNSLKDALSRAKKCIFTKLREG